MNNEMRTTILTLCCMAALLMATACSHEKEARAELDRARALYESQQYPAARNAIDTLRMRYPKELAVMKEALRLMRLVDRGECERNIAYCDSLIPVREREVETLKQGFVLERDARYEDVGRYVRPEHAVERNIGRSYLRCGVNEQGEIFLASVYSGTAPINHTGLKITAPDGTYAVTAEIPYDGGVNYRFRDDGRTTEVVTYAGDKGLDAIRFVDGVADGTRLRAEYTGGRAFAIGLTEADRRAIRATLRLAEALTDIDALRKEREKAARKVAYIEEREAKGLQTTSDEPRGKGRGLSK